MGAGKSTVASAVARQLGTYAVDLDAEVERTAGRAIPDIFAERGETAFRALEKAALAKIPEDAGVVSLGGGTVVDDDTRQALLRDGIVVTLTADAGVLARRGRERVRDGLCWATTRPPTSHGSSRRVQTPTPKPMP